MKKSKVIFILCLVLAASTIFSSTYALTQTNQQSWINRIDNIITELEQLKSEISTSEIPTEPINQILQPTPIPDVSEGPIISLTFDDGWISQYNLAYPIMMQYEVKGTFYIITNNIGNYNTMSSSQLQILYNNGNEIGSHSSSHTKFTSLTDSQIRDECQSSKQKLGSLGIVATNFAYPNGAGSSQIDNIVDDYFSTGRREWGINTLPFYDFKVTIVGGWNSNLAQLKNAIDNIYNQKSWGVIAFHRIGASSTMGDYITVDDFKELLSYIQLKNIPVKTVNEVIGN